MFKPRHPSAVLPDPTGAHLPPLDLGIAAQWQWCVDAGAAAATAFFSDLSRFPLHDHIAHALHVFTASVRLGMVKSGAHDPRQMQDCIDAFAAGYLGRIQQELALCHGKVKRHDGTPSHHVFPASSGPLN